MTQTLSQTSAEIGAFTAEAFEKALAAHASAPAWWTERKRAAYAKFASLPMPRRTDEPWRFSNREALSLSSGIREDFVSPSGSVSRSGIREDFVPDSAPTLFFLNNTLTSRTPLPPDLAAQGVIVTTLSEALRTHGELLRTHFMAQPQKLGSEKFASLHTAFVADGAFIYVPRGVEVSHPILVSHAASGEGAAVFPHTLVVAEENSKVTVVDLFTSESEKAERHFAIGANDLYAGHGSKVTYIAAQKWSRETLSFQLNSTVVRRDARVQSLNLHLGGRQSRHESLSQLQAPGAFSEMLALTVADGGQEFDQRTLQVHQAPNTKSDLLYKNALLDQSKTIFSGLIIVDQDAQKTDAYQSNRNLILSDDAEADSLPGLEIQANDVRCTHGATSSRIDPEQLFYLQSRGINPQDARELLVAAFFEEVLNRLENEELHAKLRAMIESKLQK